MIEARKVTVEANGGAVVCVCRGAFGTEIPKVQPLSAGVDVCMPTTSLLVKTHSLEGAACPGPLAHVAAVLMARGATEICPAIIKAIVAYVVYLCVVGSACNQPVHVYLAALYLCAGIDEACFCRLGLPVAPRDQSNVTAVDDRVISARQRHFASAVTVVDDHVYLTSHEVSLARASHG